MAFLYGYIFYRNRGKDKVIFPGSNSVSFIITGNTGDEFIICLLVNKDIPFNISRKIYIECAEDTFHSWNWGDDPFTIRTYSRTICFATRVAFIINLPVSITIVSPYNMHNFTGYCY